MKFWKSWPLSVLLLVYIANSNASPDLTFTELAVPEIRTSPGNGNGSPTSNAEAPASQSDKDEKLMKAAVALGSVIAAIAGAASAPVGAAVAVGVVTVSYFVDLFKRKNTNMWKKLEDKVTIKIGQKLAQYHVERLYTEVFRVLERRVKNAKKFDAGDMETILDKGLMVFPQNYKSLGWSYDLPLAILNWMPFMIAGYHHMIKKNAQPKCALANEMARVRAKVITGMKEMARKRYATVHGTSYSVNRVNYKCSKKKARKALKRYGNLGGWGRRKKVCVSLDRLMTYDDGLSGKRFTITKRSTRWIGNSWSTEINKIRDETANFLWKEVVEKINKYFDPKICLATLGCSCPSKITKSEITFSYPNSCFGDTRCMHPCGRFDYSYDWCYIPRNPDQWIKCSRIDWDNCMPVNTPTVSLPNVLQEPTSSSGGNAQADYEEEDDEEQEVEKEEIKGEDAENDKQE